jgi:hypothetical protein
MRGVSKNPLADDLDDRPKEVEKDKGFIPEFALPVTVQRRTAIFEGRGYNIHVAVKRPDPELGLETIARAILGEAILQSLPANRRGDVFAELEHQSIYRTEPAGPKVTLALGDLTLYAAASSSDLALAQKMAVDRLALALSTLRLKFSGAKAAFDKYEVSMSRRA